MGYLQHIGFVIAFSALIGCNDNNNNNREISPSPSTTPTPPVEEPLEQKVSPADMQGVWRSDGYMTLLEVTDERVLEYEVSSVHCLLVDDTALADYVEENPHFLTNSQLKRFATDPDLDRIELHAYFYDRIDQRPDSCVNGITEANDDPADNFKVFWNVFNEQYTFFELRNINRQQQYDENIAAAEQASDDEELFGILASMIEAFDNDSHVSLEAGDDAEADAIEQLFTVLNEALDRVMADLSDTDAIIIDIRTNGGGFDALGLEIAGRFFDQRRLVFRNKARKGDGYNEEVEIYQGPTVENPYTKPNYLLTSGETGSAAETFTIAMRSLPYVTLVGETTEGILSDVLDSHPAKWLGAGYFQ